ncbi:MAG: copper homeostasis protein CutC [Defluviitaleaceae bacterium]|nr:copper homeostasis protein CutC [Defluviitaleaceae bacterium]
MNNSINDKFIKIEVCCGSAEDVIACAKAGAHRVELNAALELGGITPGIGALRLAREKTDIEIITMLRPRGGDFCYSDKEFETMLIDLDILLDNGADGIAFGILTEDAMLNLDTERCKIILDKMDKYGGSKDAVFHMAFDVSAADEIEMLEKLEKIGFNRVLTRGRADSAVLGMDSLKSYIEHTQKRGGKLEILPGGGIRAHNAPEIIKKTGANQLHGKFHKDLGDGKLVIDENGLKSYVKWANSFFS